MFYIQLNWINKNQRVSIYSVATESTFGKNKAQIRGELNVNSPMVLEGTFEDLPSFGLSSAGTWTTTLCWNNLLMRVLHRPICWFFQHGSSFDPHCTWFSCYTPIYSTSCIYENQYHRSPAGVLWPVSQWRAEVTLFELPNEQSVYFFVHYRTSWFEMCNVLVLITDFNEVLNKPGEWSVSCCKLVDTTLDNIEQKTMKIYKSYVADILESFCDLFRRRCWERKPPLLLTHEVYEIFSHF